MLTTDRGCQRGGERFAIPTLGEVEGRLIASEVVASCCLRQFLADPEALTAIRRRIRRTLHVHCKKTKLCADDTDAAVDYALQLLDATIARVGKHHVIPTTKL